MRLSSSLTLRAQIEAPAVFVAALLIYLLHRDYPPQYDELYHLLAAQSWASDGTLSIAEGTYQRAALFSKLIGLAFEQFGESIGTARLVPSISAAGLVASVFWWTRVKVGRVEAWIAAFLLGFSLITLSMAQLIRFYSLHAWVFFLAALLFYETLDRAGARLVRLLLLLCGSVLLAVALHLQVTTMIGMVALAGWGGTLLALRAIRADRGKWVAAGLIVFILAALAGWLFAADYYSHLWSAYRGSALWAEGSTALSYHWWLKDNYPVFYGLLPVILAVSLASHPRPALFCSMVFVVGMFIHSFAGMRGGRYVFYLLPFFFIPCSIAISRTLPHVRSLAIGAANHVFSRPLSPRAAAFCANAVVVLSLVALFASTTGLYRTVKVIKDGKAHLHPQHAVHWMMAKTPLEEAMAEADVSIVTNALSALYYLGDYDVEMSKTVLNDLSPATEFRRDVRTGRPIISSAASLEILMACHGKGLIVAETWQWSNEVFGVPPESARMLETSATRIPLPEESGLIAFRWNNPAPSPRSDCPDLTRLRHSPE